MRTVILLVSLFTCMLCLNGCSIPFDVYLRNMSGETAVIDVHLLNTSWMKTLPNRVDVASSLLDFKCGYKNYIDSSQVVDWKEVNHFQLLMKPNTTVDLTDMAVGFTNGYPHWKVRVTVAVSSRTDTLINGGHEYGRQKFAYKSKGFANPILYYDIK